MKRTTVLWSLIASCVAVASIAAAMGLTTRTSDRFTRPAMGLTITAAAIFLVVILLAMGMSQDPDPEVKKVGRVVCFGIAALCLLGPIAFIAVGPR